jgi:hypothetical protein
MSSSPALIGAEGAVVEPAPDDVAGDVGRHHRQEDGEPEEQVAPLQQRRIQQRREGQREGEVRHDGECGVEQRPRQRRQEDRIGQHRRVIGQPDIDRARLERAGRRRERDLDREQDRPDPEQDRQRREGGDEEIEDAVPPGLVQPSGMAVSFLGQGQGEAGHSGVRLGERGRAARPLR